MPQSARGNEMACIHRSFAKQSAPMSAVTHLVERVHAGDPQAASQLLPLVYDELRRLAAAKMARESSGQTLQATALVHEAYLRLVGNQNRRWNGRTHFFSAAAESMRRILVERARRKQCAKRGAGAEHVDVAEIEIAPPISNNDELLAVHEALDRLAAHDARKADLVKLRYFVGVTFDEAAELLGISVPTAHRDWAYARAWLHQEISARNPGAG